MPSSLSSGFSSSLPLTTAPPFSIHHTLPYANVGEKKIVLHSFNFSIF
ncbi:hypothetical protein CAEBREN_16710 [Caenorhabditis brenneri]|uniref:Uncharacterized protein n=1 Tax=Caenorhabditis brenneri TaxID=135651 RepID=G0N2I9_CAEBE|nr:hypothetical protein CAEBREN_16710 [Caenorhabditis brenneri]